jgi:phospholipid/cholesterol/gamma-HCH transport system permease protein
MPKEIKREWIQTKGKDILFSKYSEPPILDLSETTSIDSSGIAFLFFIAKQYTGKKEKVTLRNATPQIISAISAFGDLKEEKLDINAPKEHFFLHIGNYSILCFNTLINALSMFAEIFYWASAGLLKKRDIKKGAIEQQMFLMGYKAFTVVSVLSFLVGIVLALQAAMQLELFGAGIYLAPMITISMIKELGPLLTAIILAGRNGSAITAEIATMKVGEEIDALRTMGINPVQFIIAPKFFSFSVVMPLLSVAATVFGLLGGYLVAIFYLNISANLFLNEMIKNVALKDVFANFIKSEVFSWLIVWIGSYHGFRVKGGADAVGRETTASVVTGIFVIILADAVFSFIL